MKNAKRQGTRVSRHPRQTKLTPFDRRVREARETIAQFEADYGLNCNNWRDAFRNEDGWSDEFRRIERAYSWVAVSDALATRDVAGKSN